LRARPPQVVDLHGRRALCPSPLNFSWASISSRTSCLGSQRTRSFSVPVSLELDFSEVLFSSSFEFCTAFPPISIGKGVSFSLPLGFKLRELLFFVSLWRLLSLRLGGWWIGDVVLGLMFFPGSTTFPQPVLLP